MKKPGGDVDGDADGDVHGGGVTGRHHPPGFSSLPSSGAPPEKNPPEPEAGHVTHEQLEKKPEASHIGGSSDSARIEISTRQSRRRSVKLSWACIRFSSMTSPEATSIFLNLLRNKCVNLGMNFTTMPAISACSGYPLPAGIEETLQELCEFNGRLLKGKQLGFLIVILPDDRIYDEQVEEVCKELGFTYHCFSPQDVMMPRQEYLDSAAHEINKKVKKRQDGDSTELCGLDEDMGEYCASSFDEEMSSDDSNELFYSLEEMRERILFDEQDEHETCDKEPEEENTNEYSDYKTLEENEKPPLGSPTERNHADLVEVQVAKGKRKETVSSEGSAQEECKYYSTPGGCKFEESCKYLHCKGKEWKIEAAKAELNFLGLPLRPGRKECPYYMHTMSCKFATDCWFHHPDPTNMASRYPMLEHESGDIPQQNVQASSQLNVPVWSADQRALNEHRAPFLAPAPSYSAGMVPPWGIYPSPEWSGYHQVPLFPYYPRGISSHHFPAPPVKYGGADVPGPEYPERPGQPECQHFVKTGFCKFGAKCVFHHPRSSVSPPTAGALSPLGLPLRHDQPVCTYYERYGICKFGSACMYSHPLNFSHPASESGPPLSAQHPTSGNYTV